MREWTDIDYAQAAIDMLPDTVEEMDRFLTAQRIKSGDNGVLTRWVRKWTDTDSVIVTSGAVYLPGAMIYSPQNVKEYIRRGIRR